MRKGFKAFTLVGTVAMALAISVSATLACTSVVLPPGSTVDGSSMTTHNADSGSSPYELTKVPAAKHEAGTMIDVPYIPQMTSGLQAWKLGYPLETGNLIPQVEETYGYIKTGLFGYVNEKGVGIGETTISGRRELQNANGYFDITNLSMLALERGATAREAIQVMGDLAVKYGYSDGGEELSVIDGTEAWIFEIVAPGPLWSIGDEAPGAFWVAQRVPDGHIAASANNSVIDEINWSDSEYFMYGPGILEYAIEQGWWSPDSGKPFSWRSDFVKSTTAWNCCRRVWRAMTLANPDLADELDETDLPFSVPVKEKLSVADVLAIHRDHYEGTAFDMTQGIGAGPWHNPRRFKGTIKADNKSYGFQRIISVNNCEYLTLVQCRENVDDALKGVLWYSPVCPDASWMLPIYASVTELNPTYNVNAGDHYEFTRKSMRWAIGSLSTYMNIKWEPMYADMCEFRDKYEGAAIRNQLAIEAAATELLQNDREAGIAFLTDYTYRLADSYLNAIWDTVDYLIWKYDMGFVTENGRVNGKGYPQDWIDLVFEHSYGTTDIRGWEVTGW